MNDELPPYPLMFYLDAKYPNTLPTYLRLDDYEAANLYWCLTEIMNNSHVPHLNTGDWVGQLRWQLGVKMKSSGFSNRKYQPNHKFTQPLNQLELELFGDVSGPTS